MRPYAVHKHYPSLWMVGGVGRPNRTAAGLTATLDRAGRVAVFLGVPHRNRRSAAALTLSVRGTLDPLAAARFDLTKKPCPCCGTRHGGKIALKAPYSSTRRRAVRLNPDRLP